MYQREIRLSPLCILDFLPMHDQLLFPALRNLLRGARGLTALTILPTNVK
jgi:hypothetical protein